MDRVVERLVALLDLKPHPFEGGFFAETYRSAESLTDGSRSLATAIYFLITPGSFSALHRLPTDEIFHFYLGDPVEMLQLHPDGAGAVLVLGNDVERGARPQVTVPRGVWQGSRLLPGGRFALLGTTMAPGYDPRDYEAGDAARLASAWPDFAPMIEALSRPSPRPPGT